MNSQIFRTRMKSSIAQSELLIALLFLGLVSGVVIAQNATNITNITGDVLANLSGAEFENITGDLNLTQVKTIEATETIEIWANTAIELPLERTKFYDNETLGLTATLFLDNGDIVPDAVIDFYLDGNLIGSKLTDSSGEATLIRSLGDLSGEYTLSVVFRGRGFANPSQEEVLINILETNLPNLSISKKELGYLEITVSNISEDSYKTFDLDENYERIEQKYHKVYIKIFNNFSRIPGIYTLEDNEVIEVLLEDGLGNSYEQDNEILFFLSSLNLFGNSAEISPSNSREGYLIFSETTGTPEKLIVQIKSGARAEFRLR